MDGVRSVSPPLPPDPQAATMHKVQAFQEPFVAQSPSLQPQYQQPLPTLSDLKRSNTSRSRATSRPPPVLHQPQPIKDAVNNAFDSSPVAQNQLDPELVRQVTEQVIRNLQTANIAATTPTPLVQPQSQHVPPPRAPAVQPVARSPTLSSTDSIPPRFTPPSPEKRDKREQENGGYSSPSPEPVPSDSGSAYSRVSVDSRTSNQSRDTPRPAQMDGPPTARRRTAASRRRDGGSDDDKPYRRGSGSEATARDQSRPYRRGSRESDKDFYENSPRSRAPRPVRVPSDVEEATTLEKIWQPLFDNGNPTQRLSQFLRGLALHLIDDYEPKGSLVVTPAKMHRFFQETQVDDEHYPWDVIFNGKMSNASLSQMYRKLLCQHHLVQYQHHEPPTVPGLTPTGFEWFMTCLIQAHPDTEYDRLAIAVMNMPISNADDKSERFPKELSRRLLPGQSNLHAEQRIVASLNHEPALIQLRGASSMPPPPPASAPPSSAPQRRNSVTERERKPYSHTPHSNVIDDEDLNPPSVMLERERKPYTAKEGKGKTYSAETERESRPPTSQYKPEQPPNIRSARSNSGVPTQSTYSNSASEPVSIPSRGHRMSMNQGPPPAMNNGTLPKGPNRRATPPPRNPYARSEPVDVAGVPASQYASNLHPGYPSSIRDQFSGDPDEDALRRNHTRRPTDRSNANSNFSNTDDDAAGGRGYPIPPRAPPSTQGYDSGYGSAGMPPLGSSYPRNGFSSDNRRSTWYGPNGLNGSGAGGTDGYGSYAGNGNSSQQQPYGSSVQH